MYDEVKTGIVVRTELDTNEHLMTHNYDKY